MQWRAVESDIGGRMVRVDRGCSKAGCWILEVPDVFRFQWFVEVWKVKNFCNDRLINLSKCRDRFNVCYQHLYSRGLILSLNMVYKVVSH